MEQTERDLFVSFSVPNKNVCFVIVYLNRPAPILSVLFLFRFRIVVAFVFAQAQTVDCLCVQSSFGYT